MFNFHNNPVSVIIPIIDEETGTERLRNLSRVTQLIKGGARIQT